MARAPSLNHSTAAAAPLLSATTGAFDYDTAFSRNLGWLTASEQSVMKGKRVAIAGAGGVGAVHALTFARLGIGALTLADFDSYDIANFNRQACAFVSTVGRPKLQVLASTILDINPTIKLRSFPGGVTLENIEDFLDGVDLYVDGLDFFAFAAREAVFAACARKGIPAVTVAPLGMGAALISFKPGGMTFEQYFRWAGCSDEDKGLRFLVGLSPRLPHRQYLVDSSRVNLDERRGPSTIMACQMCAGVAATEGLKYLLNRGPVKAAPHSFHFDAYLNDYFHCWRPFGNRHPVQWIKLKVARKILNRMKKEANKQKTVE